MRGGVLSLCLAGATALADVGVSAEGSVALPVSQPQAAYFGLGGGGLVGVQFGLATFLDVLVHAGGYGLAGRPASPTGSGASAFIGGAGVRLHLPWDRRLVPYLDLEAHYVNTGGLSRLGLSGGLGLGISLFADGSFLFGPAVRVVEVFKLVDEPGFANHDATVLAFGAAALVRFGAAAPVDADADGVVGALDACPTEAGPPPTGCPASDRDGDAIPDHVDACPEEAGLARLGGCPDPDPDRDNVLGPADRCPNAPEDRDGFEDGDGCPDPDNDADGVLDTNDKCPLLAGSPATDGCPDGDGDGVHDQLDQCPNVAGPAATRGCPVYRQVVVTESRLEIGQKIFFAFGKANILPKSFQLMDEVTKALTDHARLCVRIEGHTDAVGGGAKNKRLSQDRAASVMDYLVQRGIAAKRLKAEGYGPEQPLESNATPEGRERNRRVEFVIIPCEGS